MTPQARPADGQPFVPAVLQAGFRPMFLLAAAGGVATMGYWLAIYGGGHVMPAGYFDPLTWHHHEMIYGYTLAVIAGFLLTAVSNWTGRPTLRGFSLAGLSLLWVAGRVAILLPRLPHGLIASIDLAFAPALAVAIAVPLIRTGNRRNLVFIVLLATMAAGNLLVHLQPLGIATTARFGALLGLYVVLVMISVIGGRVIPFFIERRLESAAPKRWPWLGLAASAVLVLLGALDLAAAPPEWIAAAAWVCVVLHGARMFGWHDRRFWAVPLLWVLVLGYSWLIVGFAMRALAATGVVTPFVAVHAWTVGGIGVMTLGMMARVSLGHTGRPLRCSAVTVIGFAVMNLAAVTRVAGPVVWPQHTLFAMRVAGVLWMLALILFLVVYAPILSRPRVDAAP